jgi:hypothetical protein
MKLAKLSLAAIVAVGAMTTFASATPLEEAIKGVDLKGSMRYRVDNNNYELNGKASEDNHRFSGSFTFTIPVAESVKSILTLGYDTASGDARNAEVSGTTEENFAVTQAYFQYATAEYVVNAGKMMLSTPWTYDNLFDGQRANGLLGMYKGIEGWTFAGAAFFNTDNGKATAGELGDKENLYVAAAIGSMGPVNAQIWAAKLDHVFKHSVFAELSTKYAGFSLKAQANYLKLESAGSINSSIETKALGANYITGNDDSGLFWGVEAGYAIDAFSFGAGYTKTDKDMGIYALAADHKMIRAGKQIYTKNVNLADTATYFVTAGYKVNDFAFGAGYVKAEQDKAAITGATSDFDMDEWYVDAAYKYSKNFTVAGYYSALEMDDKKGNDRIRIEAVYSF